MNLEPDETHDPSLESWVESANAPECDFPIQNLPFGRFRRGRELNWRIGVAVGDMVLDLLQTGLIATGDMNALMAAGAAESHALRRSLSSALRRGSAQRTQFSAALYAQSEVQMGLPCDIGDYTDFYTGIHHATSVGTLFRPDNPLLPNYKWVPIGYHGRSSSIVVSGQPVHRPVGQTQGIDGTPEVGPSQRLDYELELGILIGRGNALGTAVAMEDAEAHLFGLTLFNDWSARDIQAWEYQPLGPFLSKNFVSTLSPWVVTMHALAPFRAPFARPAGDPEPLPYLDSTSNRLGGLLDIELEVCLQTAAMRSAGLVGERLSRTSVREAAYWTAAQLVAHHTMGGCNLRPGDLFGSGTLSGPKPEQAGSLLELTQGGRQPIVLRNGETRCFLADGDRVSFRGWCQRPGARRIGFGECVSTVLPAASTGTAKVPS